MTGCLRKQRPERRQRRHIHARTGRKLHRKAGGAVEHPDRNFQPGACRAGLAAAAQNLTGYLADYLVDMNDASGPGMPAIEDLPFFQLVGPVGVPSSRCTMLIGRPRLRAGSRRRRLMPDRQAGADRLRQVRPEWRRRADCDPPYPSRQTVPLTRTSSNRLRKNPHRGCADPIWARKGMSLIHEKSRAYGAASSTSYLP